MGERNSVRREFDFWDDRYEARRLFSELLGTFMLVPVAVGRGIVNAHLGAPPTLWRQGSPLLG